MGTAVAQWLGCCATNRKVAGSIPAGVIGFFIDIKSFRSHYGPGVDSASNRNGYQEYFLRGKGGRCVRLTTYHHFVPLSWNLEALTSRNPLGYSGPVMGLLYRFSLQQTCIDNFVLLQYSDLFYVYRPVWLRMWNFITQLYLCVLCGSENKRRLFPYTALTDWFV